MGVDGVEPPPDRSHSGRAEPPDLKSGWDKPTELNSPFKIADSKNENVDAAAGDNGTRQRQIKKPHNFLWGPVGVDGVEPPTLCL